MADPAVVRVRDIGFRYPRQRADALHLSLIHI